MLLIIGIYGLTRLAARGEVLGHVTVLDVELGGLTPAAAHAELVGLEERLNDMAVPLDIEGARVEILPVQTGFELDHEAIVGEAMAVGRSANPVSDFFWWLGHLAGTTEIEPQGRVNLEALEEVLATLDSSIIGEPPFEGAIRLEAGELVAEYPRPGRRIDRAHATGAITASLLTFDRRPVPLVVRDEAPSLTPADLDAARAEASLMLSGPIILTADDGTILTFSLTDLQEAFVSNTVGNPAGIELGFDPAVVERRLAEVRTEFEAAPVNARFQISGTEVSVIPGRNGTLLDAEETAEVLARTARTSHRRAALPLREGAEPTVTTEDLESLDIRHLVSQFTTYHDCCAARVTNIHLIADKVDGAIVAPGATFSLNDHVGRRTEEEGYLPAGTIIGGEIVDTVGGGVSQFATTFYNAVFWGGYEDVDHSPHSFYFDRYPEGIEATISWPLPDLVFRNDDDSGILIKTEYTDTSITVKFFGNNEGRILVGDHSDGRLSVGVAAEGGPGARQVRGDRSERYDFREPGDPLYRGNPDLDVEESRVVQRPAEGWTVTVTRTITIEGVTTTQEWRVRYVPRQEIIEVHPCKVPDDDVPCPTTTTEATTTTTTGATTTTTAPSETTTTTEAG